MTDFFGGLTGGNIRFTDARIDGDGPLPTSLSGPEGINGDPDGRYNFNESLLSGITPYAFGQGRMGADRNYQQIPNRKQFIVPPIWLPEPLWSTDNTLEVSHSVDMGDIAFIVNVQHKQYMLSRGPYKHVKQEEDHTLPQYNVFCNICTVNYLLAGLHNYAVHKATGAAHQPVIHVHRHDNDYAWYRLFVCFNITDHLHHIVAEYAKDVAYNATGVQHPAYEHQLLALRCKLMLQHVVKQNMIPIGICSMSEKQGGQHEIGLKAVQAAASFFTTLTVDGQNRDLVNIWRAVEVDAGDLLILRLDFLSEIQHTKHVFVLNHYYKDTVTRTMCMHPHALGRLQLVPDVFRLDNSNRVQDHYVKQDTLSAKIRQSANFWGYHTKVVRALHACAVDPRYCGYWHIGQTYTKKQSFTTVKVPINDMEMTKGQLLQINFAPVWKGVIHGDQCNEAKNVPFCAASSLQKLMFGRVTQFHALGLHSHPSGPLFFDVTVSGERLIDTTVAEAPTLGPVQFGKRFRGGVNFVDTELQQPAQRKEHAQVNAHVPLVTQTAAISIAATAHPSSGAATASAALAMSSTAMSSTAAKASDSTTNSDWDFEKDIENMFAESSATKQKVSKAKTAKVLASAPT
jgi:hypothetical protein